MRRKKVYLDAGAAALAVCWVLVSCSTTNTEVASPDGRITMNFGVNESGSMNYSVDVSGKTFILPSQLGLVGKEEVNLRDKFKITAVEHTSHDEVWTQPWGENKSVRSHYNEMAVSLENYEGVSLTFRCRVFDDGLGFRYEYDVPNADSVLVADELTEFAFADDARSWSIAANFDTYELPYRDMPLSQVETANTPITLKTSDGIYASVHEAALTDYPEMTLHKVENLKFKAELAPWPDGVKARFAGGKFKTPWRSVQIADEAVGLINSALILSLNEPCALPSTEWIRPMKYVGVWWGMHLGIESWSMDERHGATTSSTKKYIDFAAANNIEGVVFEGWNAGWENWGGSQVFDYTQAYDDFDMAEIARYAQAKGVAIIGHHETGGNVRNYEAQLDEAYKWYADHGVHCVKTGYAGAFPDGQFHHGQYGVRHYRKVVLTAAKYHTTLDVHEPIKDTGLRRTYPNMMTREGARGKEWDAWSEGNSATHIVTLPFTRLLAGPMDYTPGTFDLLYEKTRNLPQRKKWNDLDKGNSRVNTTLAHQIAEWVILYSPLQMASDLSENYEGHPAFQFFRDFDADCDESVALQGEPGEFVAVVRKAKGKYFLGAATNEQKRAISIPLTFLEEGKTYDATIYADGDDADWRENPTSYQILHKQFTAGDTLQVSMVAGGGQAVTFVPMR